VIKRVCRAPGILGVLLIPILPGRAHAQADAEPAPEEAPAVAPTGDLAEIRAQLAEQAREIERLKALQEQRERDAARLRVSGYLQVDWTVHNQSSQNEINYSTGAPLNQDRFTLRRGRVRVDADRGYLGGALEVDANTTNGSQVRPINAEVSLHSKGPVEARTPWLCLTAGLIRIPFGFEVPERDVERPFLERSTVARALFPGNFDLGARFRARYRFVDLSVAVMNGNPIGDRTFPALAPVSKKEIVGRLGTRSELAPGAVLEMGVSADSGTGFHEGTPTTKDQLVWRDDNGDGIVQATEIQVISGSSATPSQQFHRFALGADARLAIRFAAHAELTLRAEMVRASNLDRGIEPADPAGAGYDLRELGWYLGATQEITAWGLVGVRYDRYDPDQDARRQQAALVVPRDRSYSTLALLAMVRYESARLSIEYDINRNALGRDVAGAPTNLKNDALTLRAQMAF
jgi:hypothetical protein